MITINTNTPLMAGFNNLRLNEIGLNTAVERLSSGLKVNRAADNPSGFAIGKVMESQIGGIRTAIQNAEDNLSLIHTADSALAETQDIVMRIKELAVRAANQATLTPADLQKMNDEMDTLSSEFDRKANALTFNGKVLFSGGFAAGQVGQIGPNNGFNFRSTMTIDKMMGDDIGGPLVIAFNPIDLTDITKAQVLLDITSYANEKISNLRASLGAQENNIRHNIDDLVAQDVNISAAKSRIFDADMAAEVMNLTRMQIVQQSGTAIAAQANSQSGNILQLIQF